MIVWDEVRTERISSSEVLDVRVVRAQVRRMLSRSADRFDLRDVDLMVCEIVTNAVRYSASGEPGGGVWVTVLVSSGRLRVAIQDDGGSDGGCWWWPGWQIGGASFRDAAVRPTSGSR
ncbi:ATP-binding protein [Actinomadura sp. NTSP31]|uniref:ATP-binding protein n=1 Tax=Actinomadura sp. NTSP31 TaxID=1735447 RepID=UPI0035BFE660